MLGVMNSCTFLLFFYWMNKIIYYFGMHCSVSLCRHTTEVVVWFLAVGTEASSASPKHHTEGRKAFPRHPNDLQRIDFYHQLPSLHVCSLLLQIVLKRVVRGSPGSPCV